MLSPDDKRSFNKTKRLRNKMNIYQLQIVTPWFDYDTEMVSMEASKALEPKPEDYILFNNH